MRDEKGRLISPLETSGIGLLSPGPPPPPAIEALRLHPEAKLPIRVLSNSVGWDVFAFLLSESGRPIKRLIPPQNTIAIPTGLALRPPPGHFLAVCSRSGLALSSIFVANSPGIIDPDYTGEIKILLLNSGWRAHYVEHEHRIAQIVLLPVGARCDIRPVESFPETERGASGFGSTGV